MNRSVGSFWLLCGATSRDTDIISKFMYHSFLWNALCEQNYHAFYLLFRNVLIFEAKYS